MHCDRSGFVEDGEAICTTADPFKTESTVVEAPLSGHLVGVLEDPPVYPGSALCHPVKLDERTQRALQRNGGTDERI